MSETVTPRVLGLDIGGANLKAAHSNGSIHLEPLALWRQPERLPAAIRDLTRHFPAADCWAVTMTAELCDCYDSKSAGVKAILQAVEETAAATPVHIWTIQGRFMTSADVKQKPHLAAAANWLALATYAGRFAAEGTALLIDCGSTTTDIIPMIGGLPTPLGWADLDRLTYGELVYTGVERTPVCAVLQKATWRGREVRLAAELFATTLDAHLVLGAIPPDRGTHHTADGRPRTPEYAHARLARMVCADIDEFDWQDAQALARQIRSAQITQLQEAMRTVRFRLPSLPEAETILLSGSGSFLVRGALDKGAKVIQLNEKHTTPIADAAAAYSVAVLAAEMV